MLLDRDKLQLALLAMSRASIDSRHAGEAAEVAPAASLFAIVGPAIGRWWRWPKRL